MNYSYRLLRVFLFLFVLLEFGTHTARAADVFDHSAWDAFLKKHVNEKGDVNYTSVVNDPKLLTEYWMQIARTNAGAIELYWPREEQLAFWLNAYHASLVKLVVEHYPVSSVQKIPSFWDVTVCHLTSKMKDGTLGQRKSDKKITKIIRFSLNGIRTQKLIGFFRDEKIHFALSMAARGGPKLMREAFTGPKVQGQLFLLTRQFVNDPSFVDIVPGRKYIRLSPLFQWHAKDFRLDFGTPEPLGKFSIKDTAVLSFLAYYLEDESKIDFLQEAKYKIQYPPMDWTLNDWKEEVL